jgi:transposase
MQVVHERCCGLDVHKRTVVACVITSAGRATKTFGTLTKDILALVDWLASYKVTQVAMESTGVYWKPIYNLLEATPMTLLVVNAQHMKAVPGRKTDVKDAEWIANLLRHGLLRGSYIPDRAQRELRELVRHRTSLVRQRAHIVQRIQKVLEGANIKMSSVMTDVVGVSGMAMLAAMVAGTDDPIQLATLARGRLEKKRAELVEALRGSVGSHQRLLLGSHLRHLNFLGAEIAQLSDEIAIRMEPFEAQIRKIDDIPGVGRRAAEQLLVEIGPDLTRFPTAAHLASWARICPGNNESAGKRKSGRTGSGNPWLRGALVEAAWSASHTRTYFAARYRRLAMRRGAKRAAVALAHTLLTTIYHLLTDGTPYTDLGPNFFDERDQEATLRRSVRRIERLGYKVTVEAA